MRDIHPAPHYTPCPDLWCITPYFNPAHYRTRPANYARFAAPLRAAGIPLLTVECAFGDDPFELPPGPEVMQVRAPDVLWQKERLINLGVSRLPPQATKVAWLDGDLLFTNPDWAVATAALLDTAVVVQPFAWAIRLAQGEESAPPACTGHESFASVWQRDRSLVRAGGLDVHGHTGFAWAARRDLLAQHGLYEAALNGNGDHLIAHAMAADTDGPCVTGVTGFGRAELTAQRIRRRPLLARLLHAFPQQYKRRMYATFKKPYPPFRDHFLAWARPFGQAIQGGIGCTPGSILHLWHGEGVGDRGHHSGRLALLSNGFDPANDLCVGASGCLEWAVAAPRLRQWALEFFAARQEDGA